MDSLYFLIRYTPFWAVPVLAISLEFAYLAFKKKKKKAMLFCLGLALFSLLLNAFYFWVGGPERAAKYLGDTKSYLVD